MKRVPFKPEFVDAIKAGEKCATSRWKDLGWRIGEVRAAVTNKGKNPAFLTPVADAFAHLECTDYFYLCWKDFTEAMAAECGVARAWYESKCKRDDMERIHMYCFKVVKS